MERSDPANEIDINDPELTDEQREVAAAFLEADKSLDPFDEACRILNAALDSVGAKKIHEIPDYRIRD